QQQAPLELDQSPKPRGINAGLRRWLPVFTCIASLIIVSAVATAIWWYLPVSGTLEADVAFSELPPGVDQSSFQAAQEARLADGEVRLAAIRTFDAAHVGMQPGFLAAGQAKNLVSDWQWESDRATLSFR